VNFILLVRLPHRNFLQWEVLGCSLSSLLVNPFLYFNTTTSCSLHIQRTYVFRVIKKLDVYFPNNIDMLDMIYLLNAIGLVTRWQYTFTHKQYREQHK
jgi:predicted permease